MDAIATRSSILKACFGVVDKEIRDLTEEEKNLISHDLALKQDVLDIYEKHKYEFCYFTQNTRKFLTELSFKNTSVVRPKKINPEQNLNNFGLGT
jgi:hypothetical protein